MSDWWMAAILVQALLFLLAWWLRRDPPSTVVPLSEDTAERVRQAALRHAPSAADRQRLADHLGTDGSELYSVRNNPGRFPAFLPSDVMLYEGVCALSEGRARLELVPWIGEQGYGGYATWLSGALRHHDAFAVSFPDAVPESFRFGVGYVNNPDPLYYDHIHVLADYSGGETELPCVRVGPAGPGEVASVAPSPERLYGDWEVQSGQKLGLVLDRSELWLFIAQHHEVVAQENVRIANDGRAPLQVFFECYIEEPAAFSVQVENPALGVQPRRGDSQ